MLKHHSENCSIRLILTMSKNNYIPPFRGYLIDTKTRPDLNYTLIARGKLNFSFKSYNSISFY